MTCELAMQCNLIFGILKCALQEDTINVDLKVHALRGIHTFKNNYMSQTLRCSPWGVEVQTYPTLRKKMIEFMQRRQRITTPYEIKPTSQNQRKLPEKET